MPDIILNLEIISPEGKIFSDTADEVIAPTIEGEITILPSHAPLFTKLKEGEIIIKKGKDEISIAVLGGFLEVSANKIDVLADYAVKSDTVNAARAQAAKKKAEELLKEKAERVDFIEIEKDLKKSLLELKVAENIKKRIRN